MKTITPTRPSPAAGPTNGQRHAATAAAAAALVDDVGSGAAAVPSHGALWYPFLTRMPRQTIDDLLEAARARLARVDAPQAAAAVEDGAVLVDIRSETQRSRDGEIPGALRHPRNVLEWRADPASSRARPRAERRPRPPRHPRLPRGLRVVAGRGDAPGPRLRPRHRPRRRLRGVARRRPAGGAMSGSLRDRREAVVREHMESENDHEFDRTIDTFAHPRYELVPTGDVYDGEEEVRAYFAESRTAFPDQRNELIALHHADDAVIVELDLLGTHRGRLRSLPPTGRAFRCRMTAVFEFEGDRIVCERVYFDQADDPAPARRGPRPHVARRPPLHPRQPPADDRLRPPASELEH